MRVLHILGTSALSICVLEVFSPSQWLYTLITVFIKVQAFLILMMFINFFLVIYDFCVPRNFHPTKGHKDFISCFLLEDLQCWILHLGL